MRFKKRDYNDVDMWGADLRFRAEVYENDVTYSWHEYYRFVVITFGNDWLGSFEHKAEAERVAASHNLAVSMHSYSGLYEAAMTA